MSSVYEIITDTIIEKLNSGVIPWRQSWASGQAQNLVTGHKYRGINQLLTIGYSKPYFITFKQCLDNKLQIKKGSKTLPIVFWCENEKTDGTKYLSCRYYKVFNVDSIEPSDALTKLLEGKISERETAILPKAQALIDGMPNRPHISFGHSAAFYMPAADSVAMPDQKAFKTDDDFYSVFFHELAHSTGHKTRLKREGIGEGHAFGSQVYSKEELIAEFTSAFLCADCGINSTIEQSAAYIQSWIKKLKDHPKMLFEASSAATKAAKYIKNEGADSV